MQPLAIVIPAYKASFLDDTLRSIAAQTRQDFVVYVGDDASPFDLAGICARWAGRIDLRFERFDKNLGAHDLVAQWSRCVELGTEPWVWLFGDDDVMPPNAVELLLGAIGRSHSQQGVLHFNVDRIDGDGRLLQSEPEFPEFLSARQFALRRMRFELASYAPEYAFARSAYIDAGGFQPFPRAWCSDDATWMKLAGPRGIRTIPGAKVQWRSSGQNISSSHTNDAQEKAEALALFLSWFDDFLRHNPVRPGEPEDTELLDAALAWYFAHFRLLKLRFYPAQAWRLSERLCGVRSWRRSRLLTQMLRADVDGLRADLRWMVSKLRR